MRRTGEPAASTAMTAPTRITFSAGPVSGLPAAITRPTATKVRASRRRIRSVRSMLGNGRPCDALSADRARAAATPTGHSPGAHDTVELCAEPGSDGLSPSLGCLPWRRRRPHAPATMRARLASVPSSLRSSPFGSTHQYPKGRSRVASRAAATPTRSRSMRAVSRLRRSTTWCSNSLVVARTSTMWCGTSRVMLYARSLPERISPTVAAPSVR